MGACASAPPLADSAELRKVERQYKAEVRKSQSELLRDDPTALRARQAANRFLQFTQQLPSMAGKVVVVTGATGGPLLVAATLAERGAYVIMIASSPLRPEHKQMIETSMSEAVATYEEAGNIPEEHEDDLSRSVPEKNGSVPHAREESQSRSRRRHSSSWGNTSYTAERSDSANNSRRQRSRNGKNSRSGGPIGESKSNELRVPRNTPIQMGEPIDTSAPPVARNSRIARTTREAQNAHRTSSTGKVRGGQGGARERMGAAAKRGYYLVSCDFQDLPSVHAATCSVLKILEQELKCGVNIIVNMAEDRPRSENSKGVSKDGFDCQIQGNLLSPYLLTQLLMPALTRGVEASGAGRIVNCTSGGLKMLRTEVPRTIFEQTVVHEGERNPYVSHKTRLQQSKKAVLVFTLALQEVMESANINILPVTAHHGLHESLFNTETPRDVGLGVTGSLMNARLTRNSTMDTWLPVLACICRDDLQPGEFLIAGPESQPSDAGGERDGGVSVSRSRGGGGGGGGRNSSRGTNHRGGSFSQHHNSSGDGQHSARRLRGASGGIGSSTQGTVVASGVQDPECLALEDVGGGIHPETVTMVWEECYRAVCNYLP